MAKNGNASAIMKDILSNLFKYAKPILNIVLYFKATGSRLCMWLWTLRILQSVHESDIKSFTCSRHISMLLAADVRGCVLVSCPAVKFMNVHTNDTSLSLTYLTIGFYLFRLSVDSGPSEELCELHHYMISQHEVSEVGGNQSTTSITLLITKD